MLEYVGRLIGHFCGNSAAFNEITSGSAKASEEVFVCFLQEAVRIGAAEYIYEPKEQVDEFRATGRLIKHWGWLFPGAVLDIAQPAEMLRVAVKGKRSRYFRKGWELPDPRNPPPVWPN